jgi:hypothetical protein
VLGEEVVLGVERVVERPRAVGTLVKHFRRVVAVNEHVAEDLFRLVVLRDVVLHQPGADEAGAAGETVLLAVEVSGMVNLKAMLKKFLSPSPTKRPKSKSFSLANLYSQVEYLRVRQRAWPAP